MHNTIDLSLWNQGKYLFEYYLLNTFCERVGLLKGEGARGRNNYIAEHFVPCAAQADTAHFGDSFYLAEGRLKLTSKVIGGAVCECIECGACQANARPDYQQGDSQGGNGVCLLEPRWQRELLCQPDNEQPDNHYRRTPQVGAEVNGIRF